VDWTKMTGLSECFIPAEMRTRRNLDQEIINQIRKFNKPSNFISEFELERNLETRRPCLPPKEGLHR